MPSFTGSGITQLSEPLNKKEEFTMPSLIIEQSIQRKFHQLAEELHRPESDIIHEALSGYLAADRHYVEVLKKRLAAADRGEFASEAAVETFFAER